MAIHSLQAESVSANPLKSLNKQVDAIVSASCRIRHLLDSIDDANDRASRNMPHVDLLKVLDRITILVEMALEETDRAESSAFDIQEELGRLGSQMGVYTAVAAGSE